MLTKHSFSFHLKTTFFLNPEKVIAVYNSGIKVWIINFYTTASTGSCYMTLWSAYRKERVKLNN